VKADLTLDSPIVTLPDTEIRLLPSGNRSIRTYQWRLFSRTTSAQSLFERTGDNSHQNPFQILVPDLLPGCPPSHVQRTHAPRPARSVERLFGWHATPSLPIGNLTFFPCCATRNFFGSPRTVHQMERFQEPDEVTTLFSGFASRRMASGVNVKAV